MNDRVDTFSSELKTFARLLADRLRSRAFDSETGSGPSPQAALVLVADEIDETIHEGPNPPEWTRTECSTCSTLGNLQDGDKCPKCEGEGYFYERK